MPAIPKLAASAGAIQQIEAKIDDKSAPDLDIHSFIFAS